MNIEELERRALEAHAEEELKRLEVSNEEIERLKAAGEIVKFYGQILKERG